MKTVLVCLLLLSALRPARAQTNDVDFSGLVDAAQQWAEDNLDDDVLAALQNVDREKVSDFLRRCQTYFTGDSVPDLAQLKGVAEAILPLLDAREETQPYAAWLRARMDYFDAAEELKPSSPSVPPAPPLPGLTNLPPVMVTTNPPNPPFAREREVWIKKIAPQPLPNGAEKILPTLKTIFAAERVPEALVWLAEVESGFDPRAQSPAGALGLFQLMPATARDLGLSLWPLDQRKQVKPAARAAARYLRQLHRQFGDWRLAVAAYNSGPGTVDRLLQRQAATTYESIATGLPAETQMYVPKVEATILKREGLALEKLPAPAPANTPVSK